MHIDPLAVRLHLLDYTLQVPQNAWPDLVELLADFFPHTLLQNFSFFTLGELASLSNSAVTQILAVRL